MAATAPDAARTPELATLPRVARELHVGVRQLRRAVRAGELPVYDVGGWPRVDRADVVRWLAGRRRPGAA